ncbi:suppressor of rho3 [Fusarium falciforme]|nr:suppressor of rho3 [Fusarium falciforme]
MSAETAAANTATAPVPEVQEQESSKSKQVNLTPAPLPTSSPWKLAPTEIPVSTISIEDLDATRKKKNQNTHSEIIDCYQVGSHQGLHYRLWHQKIRFQEWCK